MLQIEPDDVTAPDWPSLLDDAISGRLPLDIHFQPIVDVRRGSSAATRRCRGSRRRWASRPTAGSPPPTRLGVGTQLEARAVATILSYRPALADNCFLSLNLSPAAACSPTIQQLLVDEGDLRGVVLEITERSPVEDYDALAAALAPLRALGATVAIDDAGAGYSSMRHIVTLEPQFVKLDRSLVQDLDSDPRKAAAITALGAFAGEVDAWVVAEGVETPGELSALSSLQMPLAQGFLLGRPGPEMETVDPGLQRLMRERADRGDGRRRPDADGDRRPPRRGPGCRPSATRWPPRWPCGWTSTTARSRCWSAAAADRGAARHVHRRGHAPGRAGAPGHDPRAGPALHPGRLLRRPRPAAGAGPDRAPGRIAGASRAVRETDGPGRYPPGGRAAGRYAGQHAAGHRRGPAPAVVPGPGRARTSRACTRPWPRS